MKELVVISGKGGTGKTSITASLAWLNRENSILADCDVDAADLHLLFDPDFKNEKDFFSGYEATIDKDKCINCGKCQTVCKFDAVIKVNGNFAIHDQNCEGCGYCSYICPVDAVTLHDSLVGKTYVSNTRTGMKMVHAELNIGADNSGKLVADVKRIAKETCEKTGANLIIVDGSPGIGCPVVSSLSGADFVLMVTESTVSGYHDLKRVYELVKGFGMKAGCIINKYDINQEITEKIERFVSQNNIELIAELPYNDVFPEAITNGLTVMEAEDSSIKEKIVLAWNKIEDILIKS